MTSYSLSFICNTTKPKFIARVLPQHDLPAGARIAMTICSFYDQVMHSENRLFWSKKFFFLDTAENILLVCQVSEIYRIRHVEVTLDGAS